MPAHLKEHIDFVYPGVVVAEVTQPRWKRQKQINKRTRLPHRTAVYSSSATDCSTLLTPDCIAAHYRIPPADKASLGNSLGVFEKASWYQFSDLDKFFETYAPRIPQGTRPANLSIDLDQWFYESNSTDSYPNEADLDLDVAYPLVYPQNITVFQVDDVYYTQYSTVLGILNTFLDAIDGVSKKNKYSICPTEHEVT